MVKKNFDDILECERILTRLQGSLMNRFHQVYNIGYKEGYKDGVEDTLHPKLDCNTCKHHHKSWDDYVCDGCSVLDSHYEKED